LNQIPEAHRRAVTAKAETKTEIVNGIFKRVLLESWKFDFFPQNGAVITGLIAEDVTEEKARNGKTVRYAGESGADFVLRRYPVRNVSTYVRA
jgi:hypothetical protein